MKKTLTFLLLVSLTVVNSQNFPGKEVQLLKDKTLKVEEKSESVQRYGYDHFYVSKELKKRYKPIDKYSNTKYSELVGKEFKVLDIEEYKDFADRKKHMLKIENKETGILYFKYDEVSEYNFCFEVIGGLDFPEGHFCKDLEETQDKFADKLTVRSPFKETVSFTKVTSKDKTSIYMSIRVHGSTINVNKTGATVLLDNKEQLVWENAKVSSKVSRGGRGYIYSVFVSLTEEQIKKLTESKITDVKLYVYEKEVKNALKIQEYIKCLSK